jgi:hypothetical protein
MYDEITAGMRRQVTLIESALERPLTDDDDVRELARGLFYINENEIVKIDKHGSEKVSYFLLEPEIQHDIVLNYIKE